MSATPEDSLAGYDYCLPPEQIAQRPAERREDARLLILERSTERLRVGHIPDLLSELRPHDLLVRNTSKVFPARLLGERADTGGRVEILLVTRADPRRWWALVRPARRLRSGVVLRFGEGLDAKIEAVAEEGARCLMFTATGAELDALIDARGEMPLPPYVRRRADAEDRERYQTVYAQVRGSVAAPTAGLHLTHELLERTGAAGVALADVILHVGPGTFRPVGEQGIAAHRMHPESYDLPAATAAAIAHTRRRGGRVVAVGTTVARVLETWARDEGLVDPGSGITRIFIHPPQRLRVVDVLLANFHLPKSTLLMLVAALAGRERILAAYRRAIAEGFRFYSYGDAMLIL